MWGRSRRARARTHANAGDDRFVAELRASLGGSAVLDGTTESVVYERDASSLDPARPGVVVLPKTTDDVVAAVQIARRHGRTIVPRGAGTGLTGGAIARVPDGTAPPVVIVCTRMNQILEVDADERVAWVQPGVLNLDLSKHVASLGLHYAPDPSSQQSCTIGGNVANNSGGPHCLAQGITSAHIIAIEVVLPDGRVTVLGGLDPDPAGYDLRGAFVGSEGTLGIATKIAVRLLPIAPDVRTIIAAQILPAALEMMDANCVRAIEDWAQAGLPRDAGAVLLVEVEGPQHGVAADAAAVERICRAQGAGHVRVAANATERALLWKARKSAFGAIANLQPNYDLHDCVVPRGRLADVLDEVTKVVEAADLTVLNVFHAGDGNLHPLVIYDRRVPGVVERVHEVARRIVEICVANGGVLTGEHGIGLEKREFMGLVFSAVDLDAQERLRSVFDPDRVCNPGKVLPSGSRCGELHPGNGRAFADLPEGLWV
jgi:glycolate oxidase